MKEYIRKITQTNACYGITILRVILGITFMMHGSQKLFGAFGGGGIAGTTKFMASLGLEPASLMAVLAGLGEFGGGLLLVIGLFSRLGAALTAIVSLVAMFSVHIHKGFFMSSGGYEFVLVLLAASIAIIIEGSGKLSIDKKIYETTHTM
jgi:putative oxidoreductase